MKYSMNILWNGLSPNFRESCLSCLVRYAWGSNNNKLIHLWKAHIAELSKKSWMCCRCPIQGMVSMPC